jgi:nicotinamide-nucleotide amidase
MSSSLFPQPYLKLAWQILDFCHKNKYKISVAESCTGGLLSALLTEIAGSSLVFEIGFVSYGNNFKQQILQVNNETLQKKGAVSYEVAKQMAENTLKITKSNFSLAITGIAGDDSMFKLNNIPINNSSKSSGLVYIALASNITDINLIVNEFNFIGNRNEIRLLAIKNALEMLWYKL